MAASRQGESFVMNEGPALSFSSFILGLASTALMHLGDAPHPETGQTGADLRAARETIDVIELLRTKTRGNLSDDEERLFQELLADLRLRFVKKTSA